MSEVDEPICTTAEPILNYTPQVADATQHLYERVKTHIPPVEWQVHAPYIAAIEKLKKQLNAVLLVHNYQTPEIFHSVADICGDSLKLAVEAANTDADVIVVCGVHFMAETAKMLNPDKTVLIPDMQAGCSLAESIQPEDIRLLRQKYPGVPVVTYVNTSAAIKAESDICCTSANAVAVVESLGTESVIFIPDEYLGKYVATQTDVKIITFHGHCEVHERFTGQQLKSYRENFPDICILAHPECPPDVLEEADFVGSTSGMINYVGSAQPAKVVMITECSMSDNVAIEHPHIEFVRPCALCPHMKLITLPKIYHTLKTLSNEIQLDKKISEKAKNAVVRMIELVK